MKKGETLPLFVGGVQVGNAEITDVQTDRITVVTPALKAVIAVKMSLSDEGEEKPERETETVITGVERAGNSETAVTSDEIPAASDEPAEPPAASSTPPAP